MKKMRELHYPQTGFTTDKGNYFQKKIKKFLLHHLHWLFFLCSENLKENTKENCEFF